MTLVGTLIGSGLTFLCRAPVVLAAQLPVLGVEAAGAAARVWLRTQQAYDDLVERGADISGLHDVVIEDQPAWANFDEDTP